MHQYIALTQKSKVGDRRDSRRYHGSIEIYEPFHGNISCGGWNRMWRSDPPGRHDRWSGTLPLVSTRGGNTRDRRDLPRGQARGKGRWTK